MNLEVHDHDVSVIAPQDYPILEDFIETPWSKTHARPAPLQGLDLRRLVETKPPKFDMVFPGLKRGVAGIVASPGGAGKSMFMLEYCIQAACGIDFLLLGTKRAPQRIVFISIEDDEEALHGRIHAIAELFLSNAERELMYKNLTVYCPMPGKIDVLANPHYLDGGLYGSSLLVLDTLRLSHRADELDPVAMSLLVSQVIRKARGHRCSILFLAHTTKASALNGTAEVSQALRGSSVLTDNLRYQGYMIGMTAEEAETKYTIQDKKIGEENAQKFIRFGISKTNYGPKGFPFWFERTEHGVLVPADVQKPEKRAAGTKGKYLPPAG